MVPHDNPNSPRDEIEIRCRADYEELVVRVILVEMVECYDADLNGVTVRCDPPAMARVEPYPDGASDNRVLRWMDSECCDPVYNISILEDHPAFVEAQARPAWV